MNDVNFKKRMDYASFVSNENNIVYIETPKCACSTMKSIFLHLNHIPIKRTHVGWESSLDMSIHYRNIHPIRSLTDFSEKEQTRLLNSSDVVRFTIVRNPYARIFSAWADKIRQREPGYSNVENNILRKIGSRNSELSFKDFVYWLKSEDLNSCNIHWRKMTKLLFRDEVNYTKIVKTENIVEDFQEVLDLSNERYSAEELLNEFRVNESIPTDWKSYYDSDLASIIYDLYGEDFICFDYSPNSWIKQENKSSLSKDEIKLSKLEVASINAVRARNEAIEFLIKKRSMVTNEIRKNILVIGDSHAKVMREETFKSNTPKLNWDVISVEGATLSGLTNPNSKTQASPIFNWAIEQRKADAIVFQLGEVDTGFVIHYKSQRDGTNIYEVASQAIDNYKKLILKAKRKAPVIVTSTCLPTIKDGDNKGLVQNAWSNIKATQKQRTELTLWFNEKMKLWCENEKVSFIDLDPVVISEDGVINDLYIRENSHDHHYKLEPFINILVKNLLPVVRKSVW